MRRYLLNWLCWIDCGLNVLFGSDYRETCSSRLGRYYGKSRAATAIADGVNWLFHILFREHNHCQANIQPDCDHTNEVLR